MFGIRTPTKLTQSEKSPSKTGSEISKVRRSIDDWESNIDSTPSIASTTMQAGTAKAKPTVSVIQNSKVTQKVSVEIHTPPKQQYENRTMEAKACLTKAKLHLNASRNTKTEIKNSIVEALDRLYQLVKGAEMELKAKKSKGEKEKSEKLELETAATDSTFSIMDSDLKTRIEEHATLLLETNKKMEELKESMEKQRETLERATMPTYANHIAKGVQVEQAHYKIIQANLQRKKLATHELFIEAEKRGADIALLQEPYVGGANTMKGQRGVRVFQNSSPGEGTVKAAVAVFNIGFNVKQYPKLTTNNIIVVGIQTRAWEITLVSYYFEPDQPIEPYIDHLKKIKQEIGSTKWIAGGDANSKSTWWGSPIVDHRGEEMTGALEELGLNIMNRGDIPTFDTIRGGKRYSSYVDVTACSTDILDLVDDWTVDEGLTSSDHNGIIFNIRLQKSKGLRVNRTTRLYNTKKANWPKFHEKLNQLLLENKFSKSEIEKIDTIEQIDIATDKLTKSITETCKQTMPTKKATEELTLPWWSEKLAEMKKEVTTKKRRIKCAALVRRQKVVEEYLEQKERYESEAVKAQIESWKAFCYKQDREGVWEGIYRVIGRTTRREEDVPLEINKVVLDAKGSVKLLAETFFPEDLTDNETTYHRLIRTKADKVNSAEQDDLCDPLFTMTELKQAYQSFNPKKAPGADGFTADICLHAIESNPELFLAFLNKCLMLRHFPETWKIATVIVLRKPGKIDYTIPKAYRPIGLLPILGKIFEKLLVARLKFHLLPRMSTRQYGFMPQRSTEDSLYVLMQYIHMKLDQKKIIALISLDIEGAFDSAWWPAIRVRLAEEKCPLDLRRVMDSYLRNRKVVVRYGGEEYTKDTNKGCVQGSIGGPILWNLLLDPLLTSLECRGEYCQAFADDVVLVFDGDTAHEVERHANATLEHVWTWGVENKLKFAPHKTNAMIITRKLKHDTPRLSMGGIDIGMSKEIKLLGVTIDNKLTFNTHVSNVCRKAIGIYKQLCKAAKVSWGLHPEVIRVIYLATVEPIILYAASVWAQAAKKLGVIKQLAVVQRGIAQKLCKAYRTVSLNSALVLAGILPLDLRVREAASLYEAKKGVPQPVLAGREVERMASAVEGPHPAERLELEIISLVNEEQLNKHSEINVHIFTDGSKIEGKVGAALSEWKNKTENKALKLALPTYCTVYQAELLAICRATGQILKHRASSFGIYSDSMAALQTIINSNCLHPLAVECRDNLRAISLQNKVVTLFWIKAHAGLEGNERADRLAKEAAKNSKVRPDYDLCPVSFVKRSIRMATLDEWNQRYQTGETAKITKLFFPDAKLAYRLIRKFGASSETTQVMTGHGGFSEYLHRFKCKENPSCICDPDAEETVPHILLECPAYAAERLKIENEIELKLIKENISIIMMSKYREKFMSYCLKIAKRVINRNKTV
ncbi:unnamed protein product [Parnassius mnemosyne]|uniref:Retrovirus-related Pol polyprotein from type-1 retrotransposable element R1 n=1 Tax=Parnassius mnemosyne TaxID=213953 RepID=A0AAV1LFE9_9NEOP